MNLIFIILASAKTQGMPDEEIQRFALPDDGTAIRASRLRIPVWFMAGDH
jgi:hypothetical protein